MQKKQNRADAMQNQLQIDKRKANHLEGTNSLKPLYKPRKEHLLNTTVHLHMLLYRHMYARDNYYNRGKVKPLTFLAKYM